MKTALQTTAGTLIGLLAGLLVASIYVTLSLGRQLSSLDPFLIVTGFPGWRALGAQPWQTGWLIALSGAALALIGSIGFNLASRLTTYGESRFQSPGEMKRNGFCEPLGRGYVFARLGKASSKRAPYLAASFQKFAHALVVAPTGSGKTVSYVIPNILLAPGSTVTLDVKGEVFEKTARYRKARGDEVFYFAPYDFERLSHRYNPLERLAALQNREERFTRLSELSTYFLQMSGSGSGKDFLTEARQLFVAGALLAFQRGRPTMGEIYRIVLGGGNKNEVYALHAQEATDPQAKTVFERFSGYADKTLTAYVSILGEAGLGLWNNPAIERVTSGSDFSFMTLREKPKSIYFVIPSDSVESAAPLVRLFFGELIATLRRSEPHPEREPWPVTIMFDEFDQIGRMPVIISSLKQLRSHNARVSIITQSVPGLHSTGYSEDERLSLEANSGIKCYLAANEKKTAEEVSGALGKTTRISVSDSVGGGFIRHRSVSRRAEERALMAPDEIRRLSEDKIIIIPERQFPIMAHRIKWYEDPTFAPMVKGQSGDLPYPQLSARDFFALREEVQTLREIAAQVVGHQAPKASPVAVAQTLSIAEPEAIATAPMAEAVVAAAEPVPGASVDLAEAVADEPDMSEVMQEASLSQDDLDEVTLTPEMIVAEAEMTKVTKEVSLVADHLPDQEEAISYTAILGSLDAYRARMKRL